MPFFARMLNLVKLIPDSIRDLLIRLGWYKTTRFYGLLVDALDERDHPYLHTATNFPPSIDLSGILTPAYDQGQLNSCVPNALAGMLEFLYAKNEEIVNPSRLYLYYNARVIEGSQYINQGVQIRDGIKAIAKQGSCPEALWPYDEARYAIVPSTRAYDAARSSRGISYQRLLNLEDIKDCLASGYPLVLAFQVPRSMETGSVASSGILPEAGSSDPAREGHAVLVVGYDEDKKMFLVRNSWGPNWGQNGNFWMPYSYATNKLIYDCWTLRFTI